MRAFSYDLRRRFLRAIDQGMPRAEIAITFAVSQSTIKRSLALRRETGDVKAEVLPGRPSKKGAALHAGLLPQREAHPDATLDEHCQMWQATSGIQVRSGTMSCAMKRLNWTAAQKKRSGRANRMRPIMPPDASKSKNWMKAYGCSLMSVARTLLSLAWMRDLSGENESTDLPHGTDEPISHWWLRSRFKEWVKPSSWKAQRIPPRLNGTTRVER